MPGSNEIGTAPARGRPGLAREEAERVLSDVAGQDVRLPADAVASGGPTTCPACGSAKIVWGCDPRQTKPREAIHPLVWHETEWMADSFICGDCDAGWIEPDDPEPITWVRPYWTLGDRS